MISIRAIFLLSFPQKEKFWKNMKIKISRNGFKGCELYRIYVRCLNSTKFFRLKLTFKCLWRQEGDRKNRNMNICHLLTMRSMLFFLDKLAVNLPSDQLLLLGNHFKQHSEIQLEFSIKNILPVLFWLPWKVWRQYTNTDWREKNLLIIVQSASTNLNGNTSRQYLKAWFAQT